MTRTINAILLTLLMSAGCSTISQINLISTPQEVEMGQQFSQEVEKEVKLVRDPLVVSYVENLGQLLAQHSQRTDIPYTIKVVDSDEVNAFALPGGYLYVNRALIQTADNESELAGVMGHEIGHVVGQHGAKQLTKQLGLEALLGVVAGENPSIGRQLAAQVAGVGAGLTLLKYGREAELEADAYAVQETYDAGIDPGGMATFFEKLLAMHDEGDSGFAQIFSTHPPTRERIERVHGLTAELSKKNLKKDSRDFQKVRAYLNERYPIKKK
ncbi:MAG: peptidase M48 [Candidatus Latescibacteria bacterium]|nr:peptidase M48 [Candidatus Latescibacterota bacterium]